MRVIFDCLAAKVAGVAFLKNRTLRIKANCSTGMVNSAYSRICGVEITNEDSFQFGSACAGGFECDHQQCRREASQRGDHLVSHLLHPTLSSVVSLTDQEFVVA
jgi:hypothetical protein